MPVVRVIALFFVVAGCMACANEEAATRDNEGRWPARYTAEEVRQVFADEGIQLRVAKRPQLAGMTALLLPRSSADIIDSDLFVEVYSTTRTAKQLIALMQRLDADLRNSVGRGVAGPRPVRAANVVLVYQGDHLASPRLQREACNAQARRCVDLTTPRRAVPSRLERTRP